MSSDAVGDSTSSWMPAGRWPGRAQAVGRFWSIMMRRFSRGWQSSRSENWLREPIVRREVLALGVAGLTARETLDPAIAEARTINSEFVLVSVSCPDVQPDGRGREWDFGVAYPSMLASGLISVVIDLDDDGEPAGAHLDVRIRPFATPGTVLAQAIQRSRLSEREVLDLWKTTQRSVPLPLTFRDSPEAVQMLADLGADFLSGPSDMPLAAKVTESGDVVWEAYMWDQVFQVPFVAD